MTALSLSEKEREKGVEGLGGGGYNPGQSGIGAIGQGRIERGDTEKGKEKQQSSEPFIDQLFGATFLVRSRCLTCGNGLAKETRTFTIDLTLPPRPVYFL